MAKIHVLEDRGNVPIWSGKDLYLIYSPNKYEPSGWYLIGYPVDKVSAMEIAMKRVCDFRRNGVDKMLVCHVTRSPKELEEFA